MILENIKNLNAENSSVNDLVAVFNYSGYLKMAFAPGGLFRLSACGCDFGGPTERAFCVITEFAEGLGLKDPYNELRSIGVRILHSGIYEVSFQQVIGEIPVAGSRVVVLLSRDYSTVEYITSRFVADLVPIDSTISFDECTYLDIESAMLLETGMVVQIVQPPELQYFVDREHGSSLAIPACYVSVVTENGELYELAIDAITQGFLDLRYINLDYVPTEVRSNTLSANHSSTSCSTSCPRGFTCIDGRCLSMCVEESVCQASPFSADWQCLDDGYWDGFCSDSFTGYLETETVLVYTTGGGWADTDYQYYHLFSLPKDILDDMNIFLYDKLGIFSWNNDSNDPKPLRVKVLLDHTEPYVTSAGTFDSVNNYMYSYDRQISAVNPTDYKTLSYKYKLYGHEFGHGVHEASGTYFTNSECSAEIHAEIHSVMFSAENFDQTWDTYNQSSFHDEVHGLTGNSDILRYLPYALRSTFDDAKCISSTSLTDWTGTLCPNGDECGPWEICMMNTDREPDAMECNTLAMYNRNMKIWGRFTRIWSEGTATFEENGSGTLCPLGTECGPNEVCKNIGGTMKCNLGESMGTIFSGVGLDNAVGIYSDVMQSGILQAGDTLQDFAFELIGYSGANANTTRYALGAIGMITGEYYDASGETTDKPPAAVRYDDWTLSAADKNIYSWKVSGSGAIKVKYHSGGGYTTLNWTDAYAGTAPVMAIYQSKLYVFWRDTSPGYVRYAILDSNGTKYPMLGYYTLQAMNIQPNGEFEAVVFNGRLYLVYVRSGDNTVYLSSCYSGTYCTNYSGYWNSYGGSYRIALDIDGMPGLGATVGDNLNGLKIGEEDSEYMYIAYSEPSAGEDYKRIKIARVNLDEEVLGVVEIPSSAPSYRTSYRIGATMRYSAYPKGNKYLYIVWRDSSLGELYMSILQKWDGDYGDEDSDNFWFTRPKIMRISTADGASFKKYENEEDSTEVEIMHRSGSLIRRSAFFGRY